MKAVFQEYWVYFYNSMHATIHQYECTKDTGVKTALKLGSVGSTTGF